MLTELMLSALTDVILACCQFFAAGLLFRPDLKAGSAARLWAWTMTVIAVVFLVGAIDHAFYEPISHPLHGPLQMLNWALVAVASSLIIMTAARQFLGPVGRKRVPPVAIAGSVVMGGAALLTQNFLLVMACYSIGMLVMLALTLRDLRRGRGVWMMVAGIVITFAASALPLMGDGHYGGLGVYAAYHIAMMPAVLAFYRAGLRLDRTPPAAPA